MGRKVKPITMMDMYRGLMFRQLCEMIKPWYDSMAACAKAVGMPRQALWRYIRGEREPKITQVVRFAKAVNARPDDVAKVFLSYWEHRAGDS